MWGANSTLALLFSSFSFFSSEPSTLIAETAFGKLEGTTSVSRNERTVYEFLGIPYAQPPVGELRFKPPVRWNETWDGVRDATAYGSRCLQYHLLARFLTGSEDCLFLNVYTHNFKREGDEPIDDKDLKPVIIYFHGGFFMQISASSVYKPFYILDEDIVFVTLQYRIGAMGFLNLENGDIRGNMGLKDQVAGLKWVQDNIRNFYGDKNKVTILGESAGAVCSHLHQLSPMSRGLFHRAISQSGTGLVSWALRDNPFEQAKFFAEKCNCSTESKEIMAKCLREVNFEEIGRNQRDASSILHHRYALFGPSVETIENKEIDDEVFMPDRPENIIKSGNFSKVPWIVGANSEEGFLYGAPIVRNETIRKELNAKWNYWAPIIFRFQDEPDNGTEAANKIWEFYFGNNASTEINMDTLPNLISFLTDRSFFEGLHHTLNLHKGQQQPIYPYIYSYRGTFSFGKMILRLSFNLPILADVVVSSSWNWISSKVSSAKEIDYGTSHGDELPLIFNLPFQEEHTPKSKDYEMSKTLIETWTAFARDGHVVPPKVHGIEWPMLTLDEEDLKHNNPMKFLRLDKKIEIIDEPFHSRADFWKSLNLSPYKTNLILNELEAKEVNLTVTVGDNTV